MGLLPGVSLAQWIGTRIAAAGLSYVSSKFFPSKKSEIISEYSAPRTLDVVDLEHGDSSWSSKPKRAHSEKMPVDQIGG